MSNEELKAMIEALQRLREETGSSKEKARAFLVETGIFTPSGELTEPYRQNA